MCYSAHEWEIRKIKRANFGHGYQILASSVFATFSIFYTKLFIKVNPV